MTYGPVVPTLGVSDVDASVSFYTEQLSFRVKWRWPEDGPATLTCVECGEAVLFLSTDENAGGRAALFIELPFVEDLNLLALELVECGAHIRQALTDQPWGSRELVLQDPDGHRLRFSCPLARRRE